MIQEKYRPTPGFNSQFGFTTKSGAYEGIQVNEQRELSDPQYLAALGRLRKIIESRKLKYVDSDSPGDKYTECNWGLCSDLKELWPTPELHTWPYDFLNNGRVAPIGRGKYCCPMDTREDGGGGNGCFYTCRVFQRKHKTPSREEALALVDAKITNAGKEES